MLNLNKYHRSFQTLCVGNFLPIYQGVIKLVLVVKEIKGHEYIYVVTWDREKKKQVWIYRGKVNRDFDAEKFTEEIYPAIKNDYRIRIQKKALKHLRKVIEEVVDQYVKTLVIVTNVNQDEYQGEIKWFFIDAWSKNNELSDL